MTESTPEERQPRIPGWAKKFVPVLVSAIILYYCFRDIKWEALYDACTRANMVMAVLAVFIPQLVFWFLSSLIVERHMRWFHGPFPLWKYFWVKGAMYILMFVNTALGGGGLLLYQQRRGKISWRKLMGMILFRSGVGVGWGMMWVMIPATLAMHIYGFDEKVKINMYIWWGILLVPGLLFFISNWRFWHHGVDTTGLGRIIVRDRESEFWTTFREARPRHWFLTWAMMVPPIVLSFVGIYFLNLAFDIDVPFLECMVVLPVAMLIMDLPIAFAGFGTTTLAWQAMFGDYGTPENIAAVTLFLPSVRILCRAIIGLISLQPALKDIGDMSESGEEEEGQATETA